MAGTVGTVFVKVVPEARFFQRDLRQQISLDDVDKRGAEIGKRLTQQIARGIGQGMQAGLAGAANSRKLQVAATQSGITYGTKMGSVAATQFGRTYSAMTVAQANSPQRRSAMMRAASIDGQTYMAGAVEGAEKARKRIARTGSAKMAGLDTGVLAFTLPQNSAFAAVSSSLALMGGDLKKYAAPVAAAGAVTLGLTAALMGSAVALRAMGTATVYAYGVAGQYQQTITGLTTLLGDATAGQEMFLKVAEFAKQTPFEFQQVSAGVRQLKAYGFAADNLIPILTDIGDAASALSLGPEGIQRIILALGQIKARGVFGGDEARQLTEAGIPAWRYLAKAISEAEGRTVSIGEVMRMAEARTIDAGFAIKALREGMQDTFGGGMRAQALTLLGTISNVKDALQVSMGQALQPSLKPLAGELQSILTPLEGISLSFGSALGPAVTGFAGTTVPALESFLKSAKPVVTDIIAELGPKLAVSATSFVNGLEAALPLIDNMASGFGNTLMLFGKASELIGNVGGWFGDLPTWAKFLIPGGGGWASVVLDKAFGSEVDQQAAINKVKALGIQLSTRLESVFTNAQLGTLGINTEGLKVGDIGELTKIANWSDQEIQVRLGIPPDGIAQFREDLNAALGAVDGQVPLSLSADTKAVTLSAEKALRSAAAKFSSNSAASAKLGIDPVLLQSGDTEQIKTLLSIDDKTLRAKFGIDASQIKPALRDFQAMQRYLNEDYSINVEVAASDAAKVTGQIRSWTDPVNVGARKILVGAGIKPEGLRALQPAAIQRLAGKPKVLAELGLKNTGGFKAKVNALLGVAGGKPLTAVAQLKADTTSAQEMIEAAKKAWSDADFAPAKLDADPEPAKQSIFEAQAAWEQAVFGVKPLYIDVQARGRTDLLAETAVPRAGSSVAEEAGGARSVASIGGLSATGRAKPLSLPTSAEISKMGDKAKEAAKKKVQAIKDFYRLAVDAAMQGEREINRQSIEQMDQAVRDLTDVARFDQNQYTKPVRKRLQAITNAYLRESDSARDQLRRLDKGKTLRDDIEARLLGTVDFNASTNPATLIRNLNKTTAALTTYQTNVTRLKNANVSDKLIKAIGQMDAVQAAKLTERLLSDPSQVAALDSAYKAYADQAFNVGDKVSGALYNSGRQMGLGLRDGLASQESKLIKEIENLGEKALKALRKTLGIKSPSREFAKIGVNVVEGLVQGIGREQANADAAVAGLLSAPSYRLPTPNAGNFTPAAPVHIDVHPAKGASEYETARQTAREFAWMM